MSSQLADVILQVTVRDGDRVELYSRSGLTREQLVTMLQKITDGFAQGDVKRIG